MAGRFSVESVFKAVDRVTAPVTRMQNRVGRFTRSTVRGMRDVQRATGRTVGGLTSMAKKGAVALGLLTVSMVSLAQSGLDFEQAITDVGAVSLQTREQIAPLERMAKDLGATTKFTATEAANAMEVLARAGFNANQIMETTPAVLSAAAASGLEIAEVANHVSNVLKGMGMEMSEAGRVADVLALASARTNSSIGSLGESMKNVSSTARQLGVPLEEAVASVALLQDVGLDASVAGSAFNTMLTKMAAPSAGIQKKMHRLGVSFKDAEGNMLPLQDVLQQLAKASDKAGGNFDKVAFLAELVGLRGQKAASNLADLFKEGRIENLTKELQNAEGAAKKMADIRMDTTRGSLTLLGSAIDAVKVQMFDMNSGPLKETIDSMTAWVNANQDLIATRFTGYINRIIENLPGIVKWIKRIAVGLGVLIALNAILKTFITVMTVVNLVMAMNPIGLLILGISLLIAAVAAVIVYWEELTDILRSTGSAFDGLVTVIGVVMGPIGWLISAGVLVYKHWNKIADVFRDIAGSVSGLADKAGGWLGGLFGGGDSEADQQQGAGGGSATPQMVSPQERIARTIEERSDRSEVTIRDETGRAEVTRGRMDPSLLVAASGGF